MEMSKQFVAALSTEEAVELIGSHIEAFLDGGPDRETKDVELAQKAGLKVEGTIARGLKRSVSTYFTLPQPLRQRR